MCGDKSCVVAVTGQSVNLPDDGCTLGLKSHAVTSSPTVSQVLLCVQGRYVTLEYGMTFLYMRLYSVSNHGKY